MPAAVRGGSRTKARPQPKATARPSRPRPAKAKGGGYSTGKLGAARRVGLTPQQALTATGAVLALALVVTLGTGHRGEQLTSGATSSLQAATGAFGFKLAAVHVEGASPVASADILKATGLYKDQPLLGVDLESLRQRVEKVGWVKQARVVRLLPDTLVIAVVERPQLAVWQSGARIVVVDERGEIIPEADARRFPNLPLIVGPAANEHAPEILAAVKQRPRLMERLEALVRVDGRRWDLRMKDGSLVQLPASGEEQALIQLEQLDQRTRILELGFERIDLRNPDMVAVRLRDAVVPGQLVAGGA
jgi:cell division protein FtsQ